MAIEGWGLAAAAVVAVGGIAGAAISSSAQAGAAKTAAQAQEDAAQLQANTQAGMYNASQVQNQPARIAGGEALSRESYLLGLDPNLNISGDTAIAQINPQLGSSGGGVTWSGQGSDTINNSLNPTGTNASTGLPNNWGTPAGGSNALGGYGSTNGIPNAGAAPSTSNAFAPPSGFVGNGSTGTVGASASGPGATLGTGPATSNTQPIGNGTVTAQGINAFQGGTPSTGGASNLSLGTPSNGAPTGAVGNGQSINPLSGTANNNTSGFGSLSNTYNPSTFYNDPSYQFEMQQQQLALNKQEAASGGLYSTGSLNNALQYAQGLASTDYQNAFNRSQSAQNQQFNYLQALTGGGQVGTGNVGTAGANAAAGISSAAAGYGNASAAGTIGAANAVSSGVNAATGIATNALSQYNQSGYGNGGGGGSTPVSYSQGNTMTVGGDLSGNGQYIVNVPNN